jgi:hypothetical protein
LSLSCQTPEYRRNGRFWSSRSDEGDICEPRDPQQLTALRDSTASVSEVRGSSPVRAHPIATDSHSTRYFHLQSAGSRQHSNTGPVTIFCPPSVRAMVASTRPCLHGSRATERQPFRVSDWDAFLRSCFQAETLFSISLFNVIKNEKQIGGGRRGNEKPVLVCEGTQHQCNSGLCSLN